jgi:hypothetical protein
MERVEGAESERLQVSATLFLRRPQRDRYLRRGCQQEDTPSAFGVGRLRDFVFQNLAPHPPQPARFCAGQNQQDGFGFETYPFLRLIVERPVQAAGVEYRR